VAFEKGNRHAAKPRLWERTLRRVILQNPDKLRRAAEQLLDDAAEGDIKAIAEIADRLDGKPTQTVAKTVSYTVHVANADELRTRLQSVRARVEAPEGRTVQ